MSVSYVGTVVSRSGFTLNPIKQDYGTDLEIRRIERNGSKLVDLGPFIELQLKSSTNWTLETDHVVFDLDADAYNRYIFRRDQGYIPFALILCCLPKDQSTWLSICEENLVFKKCCYYHFIEEPATENSSSKRIRIPRSQLFTPNWLQEFQKEILHGGYK